MNQPRSPLPKPLAPAATFEAPHPALSLRRRAGQWLKTTGATLLLGGVASWAQPANPPQPPTPERPQVVHATLPPVPSDGAAMLQHLNLIVNWYHHSTTDLPLLGVPSGALFQDNAQALGAQIAQLAFQSAQAEAALIAAQQKASGPSSETTQQQHLARSQAETAARIEQLETQRASLTAQMEKAPAARHAQLQAQQDDLQGQLDMQKALGSTMQKMASFLDANSETAGGLEGGIKALARSIPEALTTAPTPQHQAGSLTPSRSSLANSGGLISEVMAFSEFLSAEHQIDDIIRETETVRVMADRLHTPLRDALRATIQKSQTLANLPPSTDPLQPQAERQGFKDLTARFQQLSDALLPLSQELVLLNESKIKAGEWRNTLARASRHTLRSLCLRVFGIAMAVAIILGLSELWRRITFRYVVEPRRRRQFLVLRRVVTSFLIIIVLALGLVTEFSSLATFAGFITAGIAVGLQTVLLSVAAYFFIIGRYGIRVGDRITIAGVTGDVVDIGLVRLYLMELAGTGLDFYPTGRIVVFSNAVLFQPSTPLFKQIPGTEYAWHEVVVLIAPEGDHAAVEDKLVAGVTQVCSPYQAEIERQHASKESRIGIHFEAPHPAPRLQFSETGLELLVRYPVELRKAAEIDEEMTRVVLALFASDPAMKAAVAGTPRIRAAVKG